MKKKKILQFIHVYVYCLIAHKEAHSICHILPAVNVSGGEQLVAQQLPCTTVICRYCERRVNLISCLSSKTNIVKMRIQLMNNSKLTSKKILIEQMIVDIYELLSEFTDLLTISLVFLILFTFPLCHSPD